MGKWLSGSGFRVQGSGFRVSPWGGAAFDYVRKRFGGFNRFRGFNGGGAAHKNIEAPRSIDGGDARKWYLGGKRVQKIQQGRHSGIFVSQAFPSRGRCPEGADRALAV